MCEQDSERVWLNSQLLPEDHSPDDYATIDEMAEAMGALEPEPEGAPSTQSTEEAEAELALRWDAGVFHP